MTLDASKGIWHQHALKYPLSGLCATAFLLFSFWDFYSSGVRILDFLAFAGIILGLISCAQSNNRVFISDSQMRRPLALALIVICYVIIGLFADSENAKTGIGFLLGIIIFMLFYMLPIERKFLHRVTGYIIALHVLALMIQLTAYYATGILINFHAVIGLEPRLLAAFFRPAGLFQEPAHYALNLLLLLLLRNRVGRGRFEKVDGIGLLSILLTFSLWGAGAALLFVTAMRPRIAVLLVPVLFIVGTLIVATIGIDEFPVLLMFQERLGNLGADGSALARYGGASDILQGWASDPALWFGRGINSDFVNFGGANGLSFILNSFGLLGSVLLCLAYAATMQQGGGMKLVLFVFIILTATPVWTFMMFWSWLALMARPFDKSLQTGRALILQPAA